MTFVVGHLYTHRKMLDVCMLVIQAPYPEYLDGTGDLVMHVRWLLRRSGTDLGAKDVIRINHENLGEWYEC